MAVIKKLLSVIWKFLSYTLVFMVNPKSVIFKEVDDELEKEDGSDGKEKTVNA
jgi:hypothetical protein